MSSSNSTARAAPSAADANVDVSADATATVQSIEDKHSFLECIEKTISSGTAARTAFENQRKRRFDEISSDAHDAKEEAKRVNKIIDKLRKDIEDTKKSLEQEKELSRKANVKNKTLQQALDQANATIDALQKEKIAEKEEHATYVSTLQGKLEWLAKERLEWYTVKDDENTENIDRPKDADNRNKGLLEAPPSEATPKAIGEQATKQRLITSFMAIRKPTSTPTTGATTTSTPHQQLLQDNALIAGEGDLGQDDAHSREGGGQPQGVQDSPQVEKPLNTSPSARASDATPTSADVDVSTPQQSEPRGSPSQPEVPSSSTVHKVHSARLATSGSTRPETKNEVVSTAAEADDSEDVKDPPTVRQAAPRPRTVSKLALPRTPHYLVGNIPTRSVIDTAKQEGEGVKKAVPQRGLSNKLMMIAAHKASASTSGGSYVRDRASSESAAGEPSASAGEGPRTDVVLHED